jgi:UDP-glucose 4-epimerase
MVLPNFVRWALAGDPITIHGDGSQTRSFTWVGDVVWAMQALINEPRAAGQVFNIGNGEEISIRDLALKVREMTDSKSDLVFTPYERVFDNSFEDMPRRVPDIGKLRRLIGYEPRVQLNGIIESVIRYWDDQQGSRRRRDSAVARQGRAGIPELLEVAS